MIADFDEEGKALSNKDFWIAVLGTAVGAVLVVIAVALLLGTAAWPQEVERAFYEATAQVLPVFLIAVLLRHGWARDDLVDLREEFRETQARSETTAQRFSEFKAKASEKGIPAESVDAFVELERGLPASAESIERLGRKIDSSAGWHLGTVLTSLILAVAAEIAALSALAANISTGWTLAPILVAFSWMVGQLIAAEFQRFAAKYDISR